MAFQLEPNPEFITPEYWGGRDINDPETFRHDPMTSTNLPMRYKRIASRLLEVGLRNVLEDQYVEREETLGDTSRPMDLRPGQVVIIRKEQLTKVEDSTDSDSRTYFMPSDDGLPPLYSPYADYWKRVQYLPDRDFAYDIGRETAIYSDEQLAYNRVLQWGVVLSSRPKDKMIAVWDFSAPIAIKEAIFIPSVSKNDNEPVGFTLSPLTVKDEVFTGQAQIGHLSLKGLERITDVRAIDRLKETKRRTRKRAKVPKLTERIRSGADYVGKLIVPPIAPMPA